MPERDLTLPQKSQIDNVKPRISSEILQTLADDLAFQKSMRPKARIPSRDLQRFEWLIYGEDVPDNYGHRLSMEKDLWKNITHGEVNAYQLRMMKEGYALTSINRAVYAVRTYARQA